MAKHKLTKQQAWRIKKIQDERTERAAQRDAQLEQSQEYQKLGVEQEGLIVAHFGQKVEVEALTGKDQGKNFSCHLRSNLGQLVTGDKVIWQAGETGGVVVAKRERQSELLRPNPYGDMKAIAANIDYIIITLAVQPLTPSNLIDRYLVAAELSGIQPLLLLNKTDLLTPENTAEVDQLLSIYEQLDYPILRASSSKSLGLDNLNSLLQNHTSVFVGQSGVGKSSLLNSLLPGINLKIGALSEQSGEGRHTTTAAQLFHFPEGGDLIDSPGIREFGLWHIELNQLLDGFKEFRSHLGLCKFRNCQHEHEPGCQLKAALEENKIAPQRWQNYLQIRGSLDKN